MPSRKKAKGKARKAAKEAKAKEEESKVMEVAASQRQVQEEKLEERMERVRISDPSPTVCRHGCPPLSAGEEKICLEFTNAYLAAFRSHDKGLEKAFRTAYQATSEEYADVYSFKLNTVLSLLLANGTQRLLDGDNEIAQLYACIACFFKEWIAVNVHKNQATLRWAKQVELYDSDDHTLVSYYRNRISCSCLDEKYKEVKFIKKIGYCYNPNCSHPGRKVERSKMLSCTRCGVANYCSVECQRADWKNHKQACDTIAELKAAFNASQT